MEVDENGGELTEMLARLARAHGKDAYVVKLRRGPKPKHPDGFKELHLKFSGDLLNHIEQASENNYQAYFDALVRRDMEEKKDEV